MPRRDRLRQIADENAEIFALGLCEAPDGSVVEVSLPGPTELLTDLPIAVDGVPKRTVAPEDSLTGAERLRSEGCARVAVLNFASARSPGGGYLRGGAAQEEDLCRRTTLYPALAAQKPFYAANTAWPDEIYSDAMLYTPDVMVIRDRHLNLRPDPFLLDVITAPAPNRKALAEKGLLPKLSQQVSEAVQRRAARIVQAARGCDGLVLGAWGCGVFGNPAPEVAMAFKAALGFGAPGRVHFAVPHGAEGTYEAFQAVISG